MAELVKLVLTLTLITLALNPLLTSAAYDPAYGLDDICEAHCDHHRTHGWGGPFQFSCDEYNTEEEWDNCLHECQLCPDNCVDGNFDCPEAQLTGLCKEFCDDNRKNGTTGSYPLHCHSFDSPEDIKACKDMCFQCPNYVCDTLHHPNPSPPNTVFHCPGEGPVPRTTGKLQPPSENTAIDSNAWTTRVRPTSRSSSIKPTPKKRTAIKPTQTIKVQSPDMMPLPMNIAGRSLENSDDNETETTEPENQDNQVHKISINATAETKLTYEGPCKGRCDKYRLGGTKEYDFKCDDLFETEEERDKCKIACLQCPRKICPRKLNYVFICPKSQDHVDPLELGPLGMVFLITTIILSFACVTLGAFYCCRRSKEGRLISEEVTTSGHQIEYLHQVPQQRQKQQQGNHHRHPVKIVSSDSII